jgi:hypothetical protein
MPELTPAAVRAVLWDAGFAAYGNGQMGFTVRRAAMTPEVTVDLLGTDLLPFNPGDGPRALVGDYARTLDAAGYATLVAVNTVIVSEAVPETPAPRTPEKE